MELHEIENLGVGPVAQSLLLSLRAVEVAKDHYLHALEAMGCGEEFANKQFTKDVDETFSLVTELIERRLRVVVRDWAVSRPVRNTI